MKILNALKCDLNKTVVNMGFAGAVSVAALLCFTAGVYVDNSNDKTYSVFEALFTLDNGVITSNYSLSSLLIFQQALGGYISMFMPMIVSFPFMVAFCSERNSGTIRLIIPRSGEYCYYISKFLASLISGGLAVLIGAAIFGVVCFMFFPGLSSYDLSAEELERILPNGVFPEIIKVLLSGFMYGAISTLPAFFLSSFCKNPYIITCIPFMLIYVWNTGISKLMSKGLENGDMEIYQKLSPYTPDSVLNVMRYTESNAVVRNTVIFNSLYLFIMLAGYIIIMNKRTDKGA